MSLWLLFILIIVAKTKVEFCLSCRIATAAEMLTIAGENLLPIGCVVLLLVSAAFLFRFNWLIKGVKDGPLRILKLEDRNADHLVFLATYVVPLLGFGLDTPRQVINLLITLVFLGAIYIRTNLFYANPTLSLLGFRLFNVELEDGPAILVSKEELVAGGSVNVQRLDGRIFFARNAITIDPDENIRRDQSPPRSDL